MLDYIIHIFDIINSHITSSLLLSINKYVSIAIVVLILSFDRGGRRFRIMPTIGAYVMMITYFNVFVSISYGSYGEPNISEIVTNTFILVALAISRGNVMNVFRGERKNDISI